jgi:hypothetical protein
MSSMPHTGNSGGSGTEHLRGAKSYANSFGKECGSFKKVNELFLSFRQNPQFTASMTKFMYWDDHDCAEDWELGKALHASL